MLLASITPQQYRETDRESEHCGNPNREAGRYLEVSGRPTKTVAASKHTTIDRCK